MKKFKFWMFAAVLTSVVLVLSACGSSETTDTKAGSEPAPAAGGDKGQVVNLVVKDWEWTPNEVEVNKGKVTFVITNEGKIAHGMGIPKLNADKAVKPGETVELTVDFTEAGTYEFVCSVVCGGPDQHGGMVGQIVVK